MRIPRPSLDLLVPPVVALQAICTPCVIGIAVAHPATGSLVLVAHVLSFAALMLASGLHWRLGHWATVCVALCLCAAAAVISTTRSGLPWFVGAPVLATMLSASALIVGLALRQRRLPPVHCHVCGYDMQRSRAGVCPECGEPYRIDAL